MHQSSIMNATTCKNVFDGFNLEEVELNMNGSSNKKYLNRAATAALINIFRLLDYSVFNGVFAK